MAKKQLHYQSLPAVALTDGATTPALTASDKGVLAFSTSINKALLWDGTKWTSSGLKGDASATATSRGATNGSATAGGAGKTLSSLGLTLNAGFTNGFSGAGGGLGAAGAPSSTDGAVAVSAGGTAGAAIIGASKVIWVNTGNIVGALT